MKLHIFNPEHDMALATNLANFTAPHAGRAMRHDLGYIPALWADDGDMVLVDDVESAVAHARHLKGYAHDVLFVAPDDLRGRSSELTPVPWGWDRALCHELKRMGIKADKMPTERQLDGIRAISNRNWAATELLPRLLEQVADTVGEAHALTSMDELVRQQPPYVLKAPWSSSGRGVRYVEQLTPQLRQWAAHVIDRQGSVMIEPYYKRVADLALEFNADDEGVSFQGLSVFKTLHGAYLGNVLASEQEKRDMMAKYIPLRLIDEACRTLTDLLTPALKGIYEGPLGVDMMIVSTSEGLKLHPCVELNLRRTMGFVALSFHMTSLNASKLMRVSYSGNYHLRIVNTHENVLNNSLIG